MDAFLIKRNDTLPVLTATLTDETGAAVELPTGSTVAFSMSPVVVPAASDDFCVPELPTAGTKLFTNDATVQNGASGIVAYGWEDGDTSTAGSFFGEFTVTFPGGGKRTFPTSGFLPINIPENLP